MLPSQSRLIHGIRHALSNFTAPERSDEDRRIVASIEVALGELLLRQDQSFLQEQITEGNTLQAQAASLGVVLTDVELGDALDQLTSSLETAVVALAAIESVEPAAKTLLARIVDWENSLHARRLQPLPSLLAESADGDRFSAQQISSYLSRKYPEWGELNVSEVRKLSGGFSKVTVLFDVQSETRGRHSMVIRAEQPLNLIFLEGGQVRNEYYVLRRASAAGVQVAEPMWLEEDTRHFGVPFLVSRRATGRTVGSRIDVRETISDSLLRDLVRCLVQIHAVGIDPADPDIAASHLASWTQYQTLTDCVTGQIEFWREQSANFGIPAAPILSRALAWLADNIPVNDQRPALLHGDYGLHNILIGDAEDVSCILDWEGASLGDPAEDIVWLSEGLKAGVDRERIVNLYHELGGTPITAARLHFFDVMNCVRFAVTCPRALYLFEQHPSASIDACQLGLLYTYHGTGSLNQNIELAAATSRST